MSLFPADDKARKMLPMFKMMTGYFPKALREITRVCVANNVRYNPEKEPSDINWARGKSTDQLGSAFRHMVESEVDGLVFEVVSAAVTEATGIEQVYVLAEAAWRLLAALELEIERQEQTLVNSAGIQQQQRVSSDYGQTDYQGSQFNYGQELCVAGPTLSNRGQEPCAERLEPRVGQWNPRGEGDC